MKHSVLTCFLWAVSLISTTPVAAQDPAAKFNRVSFYGAMRGNKEDAVNKQLLALQTIDITEKEAYEGALLMKKAGIVGGPKKKLDLFKEGHKKLEAVLSRDTTNTEYRFLRLMIQEHAPGILGYKKELEADKLYIKNHYKKLPPAVQNAVLDYSKESKILKPSDL